MGKKKKKKKKKGQRRGVSGGTGKMAKRDRRSKRVCANLADSVTMRVPKDFKDVFSLVKEKSQWTQVTNSEGLQDFWGNHIRLAKTYLPGWTTPDVSESSDSENSFVSGESSSSNECDATVVSRKGETSRRALLKNMKELWGLSDDEHLKRCTGLSRLAFDCVKRLTKSSWKALAKGRKLLWEECFLLVLRRFKICEPVALLCRFFGVSEITCKRVINDGLDILFDEVVEKFLVFRDDELIVKSMDEEWKEVVGENLKIMWDGTHFPRSTPKDYLLQYFAYSSYKAHCTEQCVLAAASDYHIEMVSGLFGGRCLEYFHIWLASGFREKLIGRGGGSVVAPEEYDLSDRGFIKASRPLHMLGRMPSSTKNGKLVKGSVGRTQVIARYRIRVEYVMAQIKKFKILMSAETMVMHPSLQRNKMLWIVCALHNANIFFRKPSNKNKKIPDLTGESGVCKPVSLAVRGVNGIAEEEMKKGLRENKTVRRLVGSIAAISGDTVVRLLGVRLIAESETQGHQKKQKLRRRRSSSRIARKESSVDESKLNKRSKAEREFLSGHVAGLRFGRTSDGEATICIGVVYSSYRSLRYHCALLFGSEGAFGKSNCTCKAGKADLCAHAVAVLIAIGCVLGSYEMPQPRVSPKWLVRDALLKPLRAEIKWLSTEAALVEKEHSACFVPVHSSALPKHVRKSWSAAVQYIEEVRIVMDTSKPRKKVSLEKALLRRTNGSLREELEFLKLPTEGNKITLVETMIRYLSIHGDDGEKEEAKAIVENWACKVCQKEVTESSVQCDTCDGWFHYECKDVVAGDLEEKWFCGTDKCLNPPPAAEDSEKDGKGGKKNKKNPTELQNMFGLFEDDFLKDKKQKAPEGDQQHHVVDCIRGGRLVKLSDAERRPHPFDE